MQYATTADLESRWRYLTDREREQADALLDDAAAWLDAMCDTAALIEGGKDGLLKMASCELAMNAMNGNGDAFGADAAGMADSGWAATKAAGPMWLSASTRSALGIGSGRVGSVEMSCYDR